MKFLESLTAYDKDNIPAKAIKIIREKFLTNADFDPEKIKSASNAAEGKKTTNISIPQKLVPFLLKYIEGNVIKKYDYILIFERN